MLVDRNRDWHHKPWTLSILNLYLGQIGEFFPHRQAQSLSKAGKDSWHLQGLVTVWFYTIERRNGCLGLRKTYIFQNKQTDYCKMEFQDVGALYSELFSIEYSDTIRLSSSKLNSDVLMLFMPLPVEGTNFSPLYYIIFKMYNTTSYYYHRQQF